LGDSEVYVVNADGTGLMNLTDTPGEDAQSAWSADGGQIAFASNRDGNWEIYRMDVRGIGRSTCRTVHPPTIVGGPGGRDDLAVASAVLSACEQTTTMVRGRSLADDTVAPSFLGLNR